MKIFIETMLTEKGIDLEQDVEAQGEFGKVIGLTVQEVINFACTAPKEVQAKIKNTFSQIDFKNGDVMHYVNHLAQGMVQSI